MLILKSQHFNDEELINYAATLSTNSGSLEEKLLHWEFGPLMHMNYEKDAQNYLFSDEKVPLHWDGAFHKEPRLLLFYCTESDGAGGETLFVNTEKVWDDLTAKDKNICNGITLTYKTQKLAHYGGEIRIPLVQKHPLSGKSILRLAEKVETNLNPVQLIIDGIHDASSFYDGLVKKFYQDAYLYSHQWEVGDLLICDNFTYLHGRKALGENRKRKFKRIQIL